MADVLAPALSPWALTSLEAARNLLRPSGSEGDADARLINAINRATHGVMEQVTGRQLRRRTYRNPVTIPVSWAIDTPTLTGAGLTAAKADDPIVNVAGQSFIPEGARVLSVDSAVQVTLDRNVTAATGGPQNAIFGSSPAVLSLERTVIYSGQRGNELTLPETPVAQGDLYSLTWVDDQGTSTALDLTHYRLDSDSARVYLLSGSPPYGFQHLSVEYRAGYAPPSATELGHRADWATLEGACLRLVDILFGDMAGLAGRTTNRSVGGSSQNWPGFNLPADVAAVLSQYQRVA